MKKLLYLSLAALMVLAASCCKKNADSKSSSSGSEETVPKEEEGADTDTPEVESDPTGITVNETGRSGRTAHLGVGSTHIYAVSVEPATAKQVVTIVDESSELNGCTASIEGNTLTVNVPSTVTPSTSEVTSKLKLVLGAAGEFRETIEFIISELDPSNQTIFKEATK